MKTARPFTAPNDDYDGGLFYPSSDEPDELGWDGPAESRRLIREALADFFTVQLDVYVGAGVPWYADRNPGRRLLVPDAFVVFGVRSGERKRWRLDREKVVPGVCVHVRTPANRADLFGPRKELCELLGVKEYLVFAPDQVAGFRLRAGRYRRIRPGDDNGVRSHELGLRLVSEYGYPRFVDAATGEVVLTRREQALGSVRAKQAAPIPRTGG
jgi:Uma2 family endonuclease